MENLHKSNLYPTMRANETEVNNSRIDNSECGSFQQSTIKHITKIYAYFIGEKSEGKKISKYIALKSSCVNNLQVST